MNAYFKNSESQSRWFGLVLPLLTSPLCLAQEIEDNAGSIRMKAEAETGGNRFVITPHKRNYFLVTYTDDPNDAAFKNLQNDDDAELDNAGSGAENSRGAIQLDYTFPLWGRLRGYAQFFNGYGQSLIDYNTNLTTVGVGFLLSDIL